MRAAQAVRSRPDSASQASPSARDRRHNHLKSLVVMKIRKMYQKSGGKTWGEGDFAERQVEALLKNGKVEDGDLHRIAQQMLHSQHQAPKTSNNVHKKRLPHPPSSKVQASVVSTALRTGVSGAGAAVGGEGDPSVVTADPSPLRDRLRAQCSADDWARMLMADVEEYHTQNKAKKQTQLDRMKQQRTALDLQVAEQKVLQTQAIQREQKYADEERAQRELWREETARMEKKKRDALTQEKRLRDEQLQRRCEQRLRDQDAKRDEEARQAQRLKDELKQEQEERAQHRERVRAEVQRSMQYNEAQKAVRIKLQREEAAEDAEHQRMYLDKLKKQEQEREDALRKIYARQSKQSGLAEQLHENVRQRAQEAERRAENEAKAQMDKQARVEEERHQRQAAEKAVMKQYLAQQINEKVSHRQRSLQQRVMERQALTNDIRVAEEEEIRRREARRERERAHKRDIEQQIAAKTSRPLVVMSDTERQLNNTKLKKA
eukprot:Hpha_TRINITY_DN16880_c1_g1::TRINITY_DN16880_c1_g1_i1::g.148743::m.148743